MRTFFWVWKRKPILSSSKNVHKIEVKQKNQKAEMGGELTATNRHGLTGWNRTH